MSEIKQVWFPRKTEAGVRLPQRQVRPVPGPPRDFTVDQTESFLRSAEDPVVYKGGLPVLLDSQPYSEDGDWSKKFRVDDERTWKMQGRVVSADDYRDGDGKRWRGYDQIPDELRGNCRIFESGLVLVLEGWEIEHFTTDFFARVRKYFHSPARLVPVSSEKLRRIGGDSNFSTSSVSEESRFSSLVDLVQEGAPNGWTDLRFSVSERTRQTRIRYRVGGKYFDFQLRKTAAWGHQFARAVYLNGDTKATGVNWEEAHQNRIVNADGSLFDSSISTLRNKFVPRSDGGLTICTRIQPDAKVIGRVADAGFEPWQLAEIEDDCHESQGLRVIVGPMGGGKSQLAAKIYTRKNEVERGRAALGEVSDPVEYPLDFVDDVRVPAAADPDEYEKGYNRAVDTVLRMDLQGLLVGECITSFAAVSVFKHALANLWTLTTMHLPRALSFVRRARSLGVEEEYYTDPDIVRMIVGTVLIGKLCPHCSITMRDAYKHDCMQPVERRVFTTEFMKRIRKLGVIDWETTRFANIWRDGCGAPGCVEGYSGRVPLYEIFRPDARVLRYLADGERDRAMRYWMEELRGYTQFDHGLHLASEEGGHQVSLLDVEKAGSWAYYRDYRPDAKEPVHHRFQREFEQDLHGVG